MLFKDFYKAYVPSLNIEKGPITWQYCLRIIFVECWKPRNKNLELRQLELMLRAWSIMHQTNQTNGHHCNEVNAVPCIALCMYLICQWLLCCLHFFPRREVGTYRLILNYYCICKIMIPTASRRHDSRVSTNHRNNLHRWKLFLLAG